MDRLFKGGLAATLTIYMSLRRRAGKPRRVTRNPWFQKGFAWSKDGKRLVAISSRLNQKLEIFQFPLDGSEPYRVGELDVTRGADPTLSRRQRLSRVGARPERQQYLANACRSVAPGAATFDEFGSR